MPGKIRNFLWRVCHNVLPTVANLAEKWVQIDEVCSWCHTQVETAVHVLFECEFAREVWEAVGLLNVVYTEENDEALDILRRVFGNNDKNQCVLVGLFCWSLWFRCKKWVWERINTTVMGVKALGLNLLAD